MLKRILLIVSLGVSFVAPAAFGATQAEVFHGYAPCKEKVNLQLGVMSECQMDAALADGAGLCDREIAYRAAEAAVAADKAGKGAQIAK